MSAECFGPPLQRLPSKATITLSDLSPASAPDRSRLPHQEGPLLMIAAALSRCSTLLVHRTLGILATRALRAFQGFLDAGISLPPIPLPLIPYPTCHPTPTAEQWPVPGVAIIEKRDCWLLAARPSVSLSGSVSVALVGGEVEGYVGARRPPAGSC